MKQILFSICLLMCLSSYGQTQNNSVLSIDQIMQGEEFVGYLPKGMYWSDDSQFINFSWNPEGDTIRSNYKVDISSKEINKLMIEEQIAETNGGKSTKDNLWRVYAKQGDLFLFNTSTYQKKRITNTYARESNPQFSGDETSIIYELDKNLYQWNISNGSTTQLTDFKKGADNANRSKDKTWLENDQLAYFDVLVKRKEAKEAKNYRRDQLKFERPKTVYLGDKGLQDLSISPDLNYVIYQLVIPSTGKSTQVPDFVTESGHINNLNSRPKVGGPKNTYESWILDRQMDTTYKVETKGIEGIFDKPKYAKEYAKDVEAYEDKYEDPREVYIDQPLFSQDGKAVVNITSQDYKDRWIMSVDLTSGQLNLIDRQHDDAWIGGPEIGWFSRGVIEWMDNDHIWFKSEESGFAHIYKANVNTGKVKALTKGKFEVLTARLSKDKGTFFMTTNEVSPHEKHFYHMSADGGKRIQITSKKGGHWVVVSPDEKQLAILYSYTNKPEEMYVMANVAGGEMVQLTASTTEAFNAYSWIDSEIIQVKARDGVMVPATLYKPTAEKKNGAAVIFVHGAGYLQNVHHWWPSYYREYMFHNILVDNGYTVIALDFRASAGYGRDWRTAIYRHMGGQDLEDQIDAAQYLVDQQGIGKDKIGIYGGSYGGFITLMAMFKSPDTFKSGAALRSVTDWAHYNHGYTANILNTPVQDSLAYARSSPIYHAEGLEGNLLMLHGMIDTNVQFQDVVRLSQRLIELKKENWELSVFPLEGHGFKESSSWSDEYRRIYKLFGETLLE